MVNKIMGMCSVNEEIKIMKKKQAGVEYGEIWQRILEGLGTLEKDYILLTTQLSTAHQKDCLTLQKLWFYILPVYRALENQAKLLKSIRNLKGGAILSKIGELCRGTVSMGGESHGEREGSARIFVFLMDKAMQPWINMLAKWIYQGVLDDQFQEFLVAQNPQFDKNSIRNDFNDSYWNYRFVIREEMVNLHSNF